MKDTITNKQLVVIRNAFSSCQGTCVDKFDGEKIEFQFQFAKKYFPNHEIDVNGFALMPERFLRKKKFGPVTHNNYMMNLCHSSNIQWQGRMEELRQYDFQREEVKAGRMSRPSDLGFFI